MAADRDGGMTTAEEAEGRTVTRIGEFLIDEDTGEVIDWPGGAPPADRIEYLTRALVEAQQAEKTWKDAVNAYKAALGKLLADTGVDAVRTLYGTPTWRSRVSRSGRPERVGDITSRYELAPGQVAAVWSCATALDAKRLEALAQEGAIPLDAVLDLIEVKSSRFLQVMPARPAPPTVERRPYRTPA